MVANGANWRTCKRNVFQGRGGGHFPGVKSFFPVVISILVGPKQIPVVSKSEKGEGRSFDHFHTFSHFHYKFSTYKF